MSWGFGEGDGEGEGEGEGDWPPIRDSGEERGRERNGMKKKKKKKAALRNENLEGLPLLSVMLMLRFFPKRGSLAIAVTWTNVEVGDGTSRGVPFSYLISKNKTSLPLFFFF